MSKKLIAVAAAAALALTGLVGIAPAHATPSIAYTAASGDGSQATPYLAPVPSANSIAVTTNALKIAVTSIASGDKATVTVTSGTAKVTTAPHAASALVNVTTLGAASATTTLGSGDTTADFFVYQTSTAAASVITISVTKTASGTTSTTTATKYFLPTIGPLHKVANIVAPTTLASGSSADVTFLLTDVFGNVIKSNSAAAVVSGPTVAAGGVATWDAARATHVARVTSITNGPFIILVDGDAGGTSPEDVGLGANTLNNNNLVVNNPAGAAATTAATAQVTALTAQVAALTAQLANSRGKDVSVTKKKFNALAKRWNSAFPGQKVALKQ